MDLPEEPMIPSRKTVFLAGSLHNISLLVYDRDANRFAFFRHFITHGVSGGNRVIYAFFSTNLVAHFRQEITDRKIILYELSNGIDGLTALVRKHARKEPGESGRVHIVADFSRQCDIIQVNAPHKGLERPFNHPRISFRHRRFRH